MLRATYLALLMMASTSFADHHDEEPALEVMGALDANLQDFVWHNRVVIIFSDVPNDPRFVEQLELLESGRADLIERDVIVITDAMRSDHSDIRQHFRPRGFAVLLIGKDGGVKLRKPFPWSAREISRAIDKMPMRQQELRRNGTRD